MNSLLALRQRALKNHTTTVSFGQSITVYVSITYRSFGCSHVFPFTVTVRRRFRTNTENLMWRTVRERTRRRARRHSMRSVWRDLQALACMKKCHLFCACLSSRCFVAQFDCALSQRSNSCVDALTVQTNPQEFFPSLSFVSCTMLPVTHLASSPDV